MATAILSNTPTVISECESETDWSADRALSLDTELFKVGSGAIAATMHDTIDDVWYEPSATNDLSATNTVFRCWLFCVVIGQMENDAYPGILLRLGDGINTAFWNITGSDTYQGGWLMLQVDVSLTPDSGTAPNFANINEYGVKINLDQNVRNNNNTWVDKLHFTNSGYTVYGGTSGDKINMSSIALADETAGWGIIQEFNGVYFATSPFEIGDSSNTTYFEWDGETIMFVDNRVSATFYEVSAIGANTSIVMNNGSIGTDGQEYKFDISDVGSCSLSGLAINNAHTVLFKSGQTHSGLILTECGNTGNIDTNGASLSNTKFINQKGQFLVNSSTEAGACSNLQFDGYENNSEYAIYVPASVTSFTMSNWQFTDPDNTTNYALYWAGTSGTLTILSTAGTNLVTAGCTAASGGTVVVSASFDHTIEGLELNTEVTYVTKDTATVLYHVEQATTSDGNGKYKITYTHSGGASVDILIQHIQYQPDISNIYGLTLPSTDATVKVQMFYDDNYLNP